MRIDDAVDHLARMEYTCALDVLDDNAEGIGRTGEASEDGEAVGRPRDPRGQLR